MWLFPQWPVVDDCYWSSLNQHAHYHSLITIQITSAKANYLYLLCLRVVGLVIIIHAWILIDDYHLSSWAHGHTTTHLMSSPPSNGRSEVGLTSPHTLFFEEEMDSNQSAAATCPPAYATEEGVSCWLQVALGSAPFLTRRRSKEVWPLLAAYKSGCNDWKIASSYCLITLRLRVLIFSCFFFWGGTNLGGSDLIIEINQIWALKSASSEDYIDNFLYSLSIKFFFCITYSPTPHIFCIHISIWLYQQLRQTCLTSLTGVQEGGHVVTIPGIDLCSLANEKTGTALACVHQMLRLAYTQHHQGCQ